MAYPYYAAQKECQRSIYIDVEIFLVINKVICLTIKLQKNIYRIIPNWPKRKTNAGGGCTGIRRDGVGEVGRGLDWNTCTPMADSVDVVN